MSNYIDAHQNEWSIPDTKENKKKGAFTYGRAFQGVQDRVGEAIYEDEPKSVQFQTYITQRQWQEFCEQRTNPDWLVQFN